MKPKIIRYISALLLASCMLASCSIDRQPFESSHWISIDKKLQQPNQWICFRKQIDINTPPSGKSIINIAVDSKYWMWINDELVVFEGQLKRGPDRENTYYDTIDVSPFLKKGENTIAILVWYFGKGGFNHNDSGIPGLIIDGRIEKRRLTSDESWKVKIHLSYGESGPPHPNGRLPESNIHFDARLDMDNWTAAEYDDKAWSNASIMGSYPCEPWNLLIKRPIPNWKDLGLADFDSTYIETTTDTSIIYGVLPMNLSITPYMKIKAPAGLKIDIRTDNYRFKDKACVVRAEYITKEGVQEFEALAYMNGHKVLYKIPSEVKVLELKYRDTRYNTEYIGNFSCDDEDINKLWTKCITTMNLNMRDCIQDPDRERAQWWGDAVIVLGEILYSCDRSGHDLIKKAIYNLVDWQRPDSVIFSPVPTGTPRKELPGQMLASIGKYGFWYYYYHTGDKETIAHAYPAVKRYLSLWKMDERNLVEHRKGDWDWHDWGTDIDGRVLDNAWYYLALDAMAEMAGLLGYPDDVRSCREKMEAIKIAVNRYFWKGQFYRSDEYKGKTDDRANAMAVIAGFADKDKWVHIKDLLSTEFRAGPYLEKFAIESFFTENDATSGLIRMKNRYKEMIDSPLSTLWEYWSPNGSINHGWAGGPMVIMSEYIAGIRPTSVAWKTFAVEPQLGYLKEVHCTVPTVNGIIHADILDNHSGYSVKVMNDSVREFTVRIPSDKLTRHIIINKRTFPHSLLENIDYDGVKFSRHDESGYHFKITNKFVHITTL